MIAALLTAQLYHQVVQAPLELATPRPHPWHEAKQSLHICYHESICLHNDHTTHEPIWNAKKRLLCLHWTTFSIYWFIFGLERHLNHKKLFLAWDKKISGLCKCWSVDCSQMAISLVVSCNLAKVMQKKKEFELSFLLFFVFLFRSNICLSYYYKLTSCEYAWNKKLVIYGKDEAKNFVFTHFAKKIWKRSHMLVTGIVPISSRNNKRKNIIIVLDGWQWTNEAHSIYLEESLVLKGIKLCTFSFPDEES
jgi:hypothetical protein